MPKLTLSPHAPLLEGLERELIYDVLRGININAHDRATARKALEAVGYMMWRSFPADADLLSLIRSVESAECSDVCAEITFTSIDRAQNTYCAYFPGTRYESLHRRNATGEVEWTPDGWCRVAMAPKKARAAAADLIAGEERRVKALTVPVVVEAEPVAVVQPEPESVAAPFVEQIAEPERPRGRAVSASQVRRSRTANVIPGSQTSWRASRAR